MQKCRHTTEETNILLLVSSDVVLSVSISKKISLPTSTKNYNRDSLFFFECYIARKMKFVFVTTRSILLLQWMLRREDDVNPLTDHWRLIFLYVVFHSAGASAIAMYNSEVKNAMHGCWFKLNNINIISKAPPDPEQSIILTIVVEKCQHLFRRRVWELSRSFLGNKAATEQMKWWRKARMIPIRNEMAKH